jgi:hypothetical protein
LARQRKNVIDWRSTGRKRLRRALFDEEVPYECDVCGRSSIERPPDAPENFDDFWPDGKRVLEYSLQANHINKDVTDCDPANGQWLCALCHKYLDSQTGVGEIDSSEYGYGSF